MIIVYQQEIVFYLLMHQHFLDLWLKPCHRSSIINFFKIRLLNYKIVLKTVHTPPSPYISKIQYIFQDTAL